MIGGNSKMIKEIYTLLLLSRHTSGITTIGDSQKLYNIKKTI